MSDLGGPVAVTGAGGFLGGRLVGGLADAGMPTRALVRAPVSWLRSLDQRTVDLTEPVELVAEALEGCSTLVHLAGHNEVVAAREPDRALSESVIAARHAAEAAAAAGVRRVVFVSTIHVYGTKLEPGAVVDEEVAPAPRGAYAIARLAAEHVIAAAPDPVVLRLSNAVGSPADPGVDRWTLVAADLCRAGVETGEVVLHSTGQQWRDFIGMADVLRAIILCSAPSPVPAGTYNLASGRPMTVRQLAELVQDRLEALVGRRPPLRAPEPTGQGPAPYRIDPGRLAAAGFDAAQPLPDAIDEIIELCLSLPAVTGATT